MDKENLLGFIEIFNKHGMLFEDKEIILLMKDHFESAFSTYELPQLLQAYKLLSHCFYRDYSTLKLIEDAVKIRSSEPDQLRTVSVQNLRDLIEGLKLHLHYNKRLTNTLKRLVKETNLIDYDRRLFIQYVTYLGDFNLKTDPVLKAKLNDALNVHRATLTNQDIIQLKLYGQEIFPADILQGLTLKEQASDFSLDSKEKLALIDPGNKLNPDQSLEAFKTIDLDCNVLDVIEGMLKERGIPYSTREIAANGTIRAAFVAELPKGRTIIDVIDQQHGYFVSEEGEKRLRLKGRVADEVARKSGYPGGYRVVSLVEMDFCGDEQAFLNEVIFDEKPSKANIRSQSL
ncbi:hypothetical protein FGO68_gene2730 [Halteria grandinella]|uniref:Uncharacterized protein n=1 Tax=Halteria grandinella TaxID=5974 RepID=A0A8J8NWC8_HALGN|nr:hypothetical protein FGO68_gene2730 [Halteria grandinella]